MRELNGSFSKAFQGFSGGGFKLSVIPLIFHRGAEHGLQNLSLTVHIIMYPSLTNISTSTESIAVHVRGWHLCRRCVFTLSNFLVGYYWPSFRSISSLVVHSCKQYGYIPTYLSESPSPGWSLGHIICILIRYFQVNDGESLKAKWVDWKSAPKSASL